MRDTDRIIEPRELELAAFHEAGKAVMAFFRGSSRSPGATPTGDGGGWYIPAAVPYFDDSMWPRGADVTENAPGREQAMGVLSIDALRRKPGGDNR